MKKTLEEKLTKIVIDFKTNPLMKGSIFFNEDEEYVSLDDYSVGLLEGNNEEQSIWIKKDGTLCFDPMDIPEYNDFFGWTLPLNIEQQELVTKTCKLIKEAYESGS